MWTRVFITALATYANIVRPKLILDDKIINIINTDTSSSWVAERSIRFEGMTMFEAQRMLGIKPTWDGYYIYTQSAVDVPSSFDSRIQWPSCTSEIRDQQECGSCWAFSASEVLQDRLCIKTGTFTMLSPQYIVSCDSGNMGCNGGYLDEVWRFLEARGTTTDTCVPYTAGQGSLKPCPSSCSNGQSIITYRASGAKQLYGVSQIQTDIMTNGPVQASFSVYQDFFAYKSGVYIHKTGSLAGGHAIKIIGWGLDSSSQKPYWIVANSWGTSWGMNGFFWILRGRNECGIEDNVWSGQA